jgi:CRAL/TRIO domain
MEDQAGEAPPMEEAQEHESGMNDGRRSVPENVVDAGLHEDQDNRLAQAQNVPMPPDDPRRMLLTIQERSCALKIKQIIESTTGIDNLPDFWYAQLAIIEHENYEGAIKRAKQLQSFREEYGLEDNFSEGQDILYKLVKLFPRHYLCFSYSYYSYAITVDLKGLDLSLLNTQDQMRTWLCACYYTCACICPDMDAIRRGVNSMVECNGFDMSLHIDLTTSRRIVDELLAHYPFRYQNAYFYHSGLSFNVLFGLIKRYLPESWQQIFRFGCRGPMYLDEIHMVPDVETSNQKTLQKLIEALRRRYKHEQEFSLCE